MIELDVVAYLKTDAELYGLLSATASNSKIYPIQMPQNTTLPYIAYVVESEGTTQENMREIIIAFDCVAETYAAAKNIRDNLIDILDQEDNIQNLITSTDYKVYWGKKTAGYTFKEAALNVFHDVAVFSFQYAKYAQSYIDVINKFSVFHYTGTLVDEETIFNKFRFQGTVIIKKIELHARTAPTGANLTIDILKNSVEQSNLATLTAGSTDEITNITDITFTSSDDFGLKIKSVGTTVAGEDLNIVIHYT